MTKKVMVVSSMASIFGILIFITFLTLPAEVEAGAKVQGRVVRPVVGDLLRLVGKAQVVVEMTSRQTISPSKRKCFLPD